MSKVDRSTHQKRMASIMEAYDSCTLVAATGYGKTNVGLLLMGNAPTNENIIVVVPTLLLKTQWEKTIDRHRLGSKLKLGPNIKVIVINSAAALPPTTCHTLIVDEYHRVGATTFKKVLTAISYTKLYTLTATINRADGEHAYLEKMAPIKAIVSMQKCVENDWVSDYIILNWALELPELDRKKYDKINNMLRYHASILTKNGGFAFNKAMKYLNLKNVFTREDKVFKSSAFMYMKNVRERLALLKNHDNKITANLAVIGESFGEDKIITFNHSLDFINTVVQNINDKYSFTKQSILSAKVSKKNVKQIIDDFSNPDEKNCILHTMKMADEGMDIPNLNVGIINGGSSSEREHIQRRGRLLRVGNNLKKSILINIYFKDTVEEDHLTNRLTNEVKEKIKTCRTSAEVSEVFNSNLTAKKQ